MEIQTCFKELLARKERVERRKISRRTVVEETGISLTSVQNWATNKVTQFQHKQIIAFCEYFNCAIGELLIIVDDEEDDPEEHEELRTSLIEEGFLIG